MEWHLLEEIACMAGSLRDMEGILRSDQQFLKGKFKMRCVSLERAASSREGWLGKGELRQSPSAMVFLYHITITRATYRWHSSLFGKWWLLGCSIWHCPAPQHLNITFLKLDLNVFTTFTTICHLCNTGYFTFKHLRTLFFTSEILGFPRSVMSTTQNRTGSLDEWELSVRMLACPQERHSIPSTNNNNTEKGQG